MNDYKYKTLDDALSDAIGSSISNNDTFYENPVTHEYSDNYLPANRYDDVIKEAIKNIKDTKCIDIKFKGEI